MREKISICMATYNGEKYIREQLDSILCQIEDEDEVIISDDNSTDNTIRIIKDYKDSRIKIYVNFNKKGPVSNFENAISKSNGKIIFLSDQDDIWCKDKVERILKKFHESSQTTCVFTNAGYINESGKETGKQVFSKEPAIVFFKLLMKNKFLGCTMAFKRNNEIIRMPFPKSLPMHDWYIGLRHILRGKVEFINENLIFYRRHDDNVTSGKSASILTILKWRILIIKSLIFY